MTNSVYFDVADDEHIAREKRKARDLRNSQWWKNRRAHNTCHYCKNQFPAKSLTMDHVVPLSRGGKSTRSNVVPACKECNSSKRYLLPSEWDMML